MAEPLPPRLPDAAVEAVLADLDGVLGQVEAMPGPGRELALEAIASLTEVYGEALARIVEAVSSGRATLGDLAGDRLVGHLMILHRLQPEHPGAQTPPAAVPEAPTFIPLAAVGRRSRA